jgi:SAM-dependent methyltransferase
MRRRDTAYCPRCNAKARHRRIWRYLQDHTNLFVDRVRVLEVSPKYAFSRRFVRMPNLEFVGVDRAPRPNIHAVTDLTAASLRSDTFDAAICVHVLEEIPDDRRAMAELFRVLRPGGWALVTVPTRMDRPTVEDPAIVDPKERKRRFGEAAHVRVYGNDLVDRLEEAGFRVKVDLADDVPLHERERYGLRDDENIFSCWKPT